MFTITLFRNGSSRNGSVSTHDQGMYLVLEMISVRENNPEKVSVNYVFAHRQASRQIVLAYYVTYILTLVLYSFMNKLHLPSVPSC